MTHTIERQRPKLRKPILREVRLVGDPFRRYVHLDSGGLRTEDSGPRTLRDRETGRVTATISES